MLRNLEALARAPDGLRVEVVQIDDGYQRAVGDWLDTCDRFPRGLEALAREIRDAGFTRPGRIESDPPRLLLTGRLPC